MDSGEEFRGKFRSARSVSCRWDRNREYIPENVSREVVGTKLFHYPLCSAIDAYDALFDRNKRVAPNPESRAFLDWMCQGAKFTPEDVEAYGYEWTADVISDGEMQDCRKKPSQDFVKNCVDRLEKDPDIDRFKKSFPEGAQRARFLEWLTVAGAILGAVTHFFQKNPGPGGTFGDVCDYAAPVLLPPVIAITSAAYIYKKHTAFNRNVANLEQAATPLIVDEWVKAAEKHGGCTVAFQDIHYDLYNQWGFNDMAMRSGLRFRWEKFRRNRTVSQIAKARWKVLGYDDIRQVDPALLKEFVDDRLWPERKSERADRFRGFEIRFRPSADHLELAGTQLRFMALPKVQKNTPWYDAIRLG